MSNNNVLIKKFESQIKSNKNLIEKFRKTINGYGFSNCKSPKDFEFQKLKLEIELDDIKEDIKKAGLKYDPASVVVLKQKEGRIRTKINDINDILVLFDKIDQLNIKISNIEVRLKKLKGKIQPIDVEREKMNIVLRALRNNCSCEDAAKIANVKLRSIVNWIHEGRDRTNKNKIYFYKQYLKIESNKKRRIKRLLKHLKNGKTIVEACKLSNISIKEFNIWYAYGKSGKDKLNVEFYKNVNIIKRTDEKVWNNFLDERHKSGGQNNVFKNVGVI